MRAEARANIERHLAILERQLAGTRYLVADEFSLADICYIPGLDFLPLMENRAAARPWRRGASGCWRGLARPGAVATRPGA